MVSSKVYIIVENSSLEDFNFAKIVVTTICYKNTCKERPCKNQIGFKMRKVKINFKIFLSQSALQLIVHKCCIKYETYN